jgi:CheY-like chemotaxis protein
MEKVIVFVHHDIQVLKDYLSYVTDRFSSDYVLATAQRHDQVITIIEQNIESGNDVVACVVSDDIPKTDGIDLLKAIHKISPSSVQILTIAQKNKELSTNKYYSTSVNLFRCMFEPVNPKDFALSLKNAVSLSEHQNEVKTLRVRATDNEAIIAKRVEEGIEDVSQRKSFLQALVQARLDFLGDSVGLLQKHSGSLEEIIEFFESLKTQMSTKEKARLAPGFYEIRNGIQELVAWNKNIGNTFLVNQTDFNLKFLISTEAQHLETRLKSKRLKFKENINSEVRVKVDYHILLAIIRNIQNFLGDITPAEGQLIYLSQLNGTHVDVYLQNSSDNLSVEQIETYLNHHKLPENSTSKAEHFISWPIIKEFMRLNEGDISFKKVNNGTQFKISLQASKMYLTMLSAIKNTQSAYNLKHVNVLLVDDTDINLMIMLKQLTHYGFNITTCSNGFEAIRQAASVKYDYVFMDLVMPKLDGYAAAKIISEEQYRLGASPKIVFQTAHAKMMNKSKMKEAGGDRIILKPLTKLVLEDIIHDHIKDFEALDT